MPRRKGKEQNAKKTAMAPDHSRTLACRYPLQLKELAALAASLCPEPVPLGRQPLDHETSLLRRLGENPPIVPDAKGRDSLCWDIGSYTLDRQHFARAASGVVPLAFLQIAIDGFNNHVESMSICLPLDFLDLATTDQEAYLLKEYNYRASFLTYLEFECVFWQSEWRLILPHCNETEMINFLVVTNTFANNKWTLTAATLYKDSHLMNWRNKIERMLAKIVEPLEEGIMNSDNGANHETTSSHAITVGRFLGVLFVENNAALSIYNISDNVATGLINHLHLWLYNAVHEFDHTVVEWWQCAASGCRRKWWTVPRGALATWNQGIFVCQAMGALCGQGNADLRTRVHCLQQEKDLLRQENTELMQQKNNVQQQKHEILQQNAALLQAKDLLQQEKDRLQQEKDRLQQEKDRLQQEKDRLQQEHTELMQQKDNVQPQQQHELLQQNAELLQEKNLLQQQNSENERLQMLNQENATGTGDKRDESDNDSDFATANDEDDEGPGINVNDEDDEGPGINVNDEDDEGPGTNVNVNDEDDEGPGTNVNDFESDLCDKTPGTGANATKHDSPKMKAGGLPACAASTVCPVCSLPWSDRELVFNGLMSMKGLVQKEKAELMRLRTIGLVMHRACNLWWSLKDRVYEVVVNEVAVPVNEVDVPVTEVDVPVNVDELVDEPDPKRIRMVNRKRSIPTFLTWKIRDVVRKSSITGLFDSLHDVGTFNRWLEEFFARVSNSIQLSARQKVASQIWLIASSDGLDKALKVAKVRKEFDIRNPPFRVFHPLIQQYLEAMKTEILGNWTDHARDFTKSSFVNHLIVSLTSRKHMWTENGFFPATTAALEQEMKLEEAVPLVKTEVVAMDLDGAMSDEQEI